MIRRTMAIVVLCATALVAACATAGGALIGAGIGRTQGDEKAGAMIGAGAGMMIDVMR